MANEDWLLHILYIDKDKELQHAIQKCLDTALGGPCCT